MGRKFHKSKPLGQISIALVSVQSKTTIMRNRRGNSSRPSSPGKNEEKRRNNKKQLYKFFQSSGEGQILDKCFKSGCGMLS